MQLVQFNAAPLSTGGSDAAGDAVHDGFRAGERSRTETTTAPADCRSRRVLSGGDPASAHPDLATGAVLGGVAPEAPRHGDGDAMAAVSRTETQPQALGTRD